MAERVMNYCPRCGALLHNPKDYSIQWIDDRREFIVKLLFNCTCGSLEQELKELPVSIAQKSNCKCGSTLMLSNYKIEREGDEIVFEGTYFCNECGLSEHSQLKDLKHRILTIWKKTTAIELGPTGIRYEKGED